MTRSEGRPVRLGIIGSGRMARVRADNLASSLRARLVAVASRNAATGQALAVEHGCAFAGPAERLLERDDLDAVVVCTHNASHSELALAALAADRHVLLEYPLALDVREAEAVVAAARRSRLALCVAYDQVWLAPHAELRAAIQQNGPPLELRVRVAWPGAPVGSPFRNVRLGGPPALVKPYYLQAILEWLGAPNSYTAALHYTGLRPDGHYDTAAHHLVLGYPGTLARASWLVDPRFAERRVEVELTWDGHALVTDGRRIVLRRGATGELDLPVTRMNWRWATGHGLARFLDAIQGDADLTADASLAVATVRIGAAPVAAAHQDDGLWRAA